MKYTEEEVDQFISLNKEQLDYILLSLPKENRTANELRSTARQFMSLLDYKSSLENKNCSEDA